MTPAEAQFAMTYVVNPIMLIGGVAASLPGGTMPIILITQGINFSAGIAAAATANIDLDAFFAHFRPIVGGSAIDYQLGQYPFPDQSTAANALVAQPLKISMLMTCPVRQPGGYSVKNSIVAALQSTLSQHNNLGGTYTVMTPGVTYSPCVLTGMHDASNGDSAQAQNGWQLDFEKPLLTLSQAQQQENALMSKISSQTQVNGQPSWSGSQTAIGQPSSLAAPPTIPASTGAGGAGIVSTVGI